MSAGSASSGATTGGSAGKPVRYPNLAAPDVMTKRAWWLVVLNVLVPGSAQVLAGNRRLGRFGLGATLVLWALVVVALVAWFLWPVAVTTVLALSWSLWILAAIMVFYAVLWIVLTLDTLRLVRLVKTVPSARGWIAGIATVLLVATSGGAAYGAFLATTAGGFVSDVFVFAEPEPPINGRYNILLLGGDAGPDRDGMRPDSMTVASIDAVTGEAVLIGLPRDLANAPFPETSPMYAMYPNGYGAEGCEVDVCQLNSIFTEVELYYPELYPDAAAQGSSPGIQAMSDAASGITGLTMQYYALIDMAGFSQLIDALGGVTISVAEAVPVHSDENFENVAFWIGPGAVQMDGYTALWYARVRHNTTDYDRMLRQRQLQEAILLQFNPANVLSKFQAVAEAGAQVVRTDVPQTMLGFFVDLAGKTKELPIGSIELTPLGGIDPEYPDYEYIHTIIAEATAPPPTAEPEG